MPSDGTTAFISYSREDSEFVLRMARDLKAAGADVWLDQMDIQPGQRWARALQDAITNSPRFLVILSPASVKSTNVEDEVTFALEERKTIIPVMYCDCNVPFQLRSFQYADFRSDYDRGLRILLQTLGVGAVLPEAADAGESARRERAAGERVRQEEAAAASAAAERRREEAAAAEGGQKPHRLGSLARVFMSGATILIFVGIAYWMFFRGSSPPPQPAPVSHAKPLIFKSPTNNGQLNGTAASGTSAASSGNVDGAETAAGDTGRAALLGEHRLSLQWISWEKFGTVSVVDNDGVLILKGSQHVGDEYLTVEGSVTSIEPKKFTMHGVIVTKIDSINNGQPCKRSGDMTFAIADAGQYWRLQQMNNPCGAVTDYVDIYLR